MGFDIDDMPFERAKGRETVDIVMMQVIGIMQSTLQGFRLTPLPCEQQAPLIEEKEEEEEEVDDMVVQSGVACTKKCIAMHDLLFRD